MREWISIALALLLLALLLLGGCVSLADMRRAKDLEAQWEVAAACAAGRGATNRMFKDAPRKLAALDLLCDGPDLGRQAPTLDANTLDVIRALLQSPVPK